MGDKRGLSEVITTLLIIGLSLAAIVIIWVVIQNIISTGSDQVSLGKFTMDLQIEKVLINPGTLEVTVKRNPGKGELNGLKFIISDGTSTEVLEEKNLLGKGKGKSKQEAEQQAARDALEKMGKT